MFKNSTLFGTSLLLVKAALKVRGLGKIIPGFMSYFMLTDQKL